MIKAIVTDIDGVLTDGRIYVGDGKINKSICFKDLDAITMIRNEGLKIGVITGEKDFFTEYVKKAVRADLFIDNCKEKLTSIKQFATDNHLELSEICYIGDGKYDVEAIDAVGIGVCPADAIDEVRKTADLVLDNKGGFGCISELYSKIRVLRSKLDMKGGNCTLDFLINKTISSHQQVIGNLLNGTEIIQSINKTIMCIVQAFRNDRQLLLCGNGGSAADSQHLATEFISRFYKERQALNAEALTVNTSTLTAVANDYEYNKVFARQVEAKGKEGDILLGITTSGTSASIVEAFKEAKRRGLVTIAFTGYKYEHLRNITDIVIPIPSLETPRIQEMHILIGHIICEQVERILCE